MKDDLYSIIKEGAFADKAEFDGFVKQSTPEEIYKLVKDGAFSSFEEFKQFFFKDGQVDGNVEDVKKKDEGMVLPSEDGSLDSSENESLAQQKQFLEGTMQQSPVESTDTFKPQSAEALAVEEEVVEEPQIVSPELQEARLGPTDEEKRKSELFADVSQFKAQSKERLEERQAKVTEGLEREDILLSEDFNNAINATTPETINLPQQDAVKYYNDLYGDYGFTFREAGSGMGDAIEGFVLLSDGTVKTKRFNINSMFVNNADTAENIQEFVKTYATTPDEDRSIIESNDMKSAIRAQNLRDVARKNEDGTESTVLFESAVIDGKNVVYPTLFPINPELKTSDPDFWNELDGMDAYKEALKRKEVFVFDNEEKANDFARGSWKELNNADAEGYSFFNDRGYDYLDVKKKYDAYREAQDRIDFIEEHKDVNYAEFNSLSDEEKELYGDLYRSDGTIRTDLDGISKKLEATVEGLEDFIIDDDLQILREDFDVYIDDKYRKLSQEASISKETINVISDALDKKSISTFGVPLSELKDFVPQNEEQAELQELYNIANEKLKFNSQQAARNYLNAETFLSAKFDKQLSGKLLEDMEAWKDAVGKAGEQGTASIEIAKMALGITDIDDKDSLMEAAEKVVNALEAANTGNTSRAMSRYNASRGFIEGWDAFADNPIELITTFTASTINQMLPYATFVVPTLITTTALGGLYGSAVPVIGTKAGLVTGFGYGVKASTAAVGFAMEYTNEVLDAARERGDIMDPKKFADIISDPEVWKEGSRRGFKRGLPIMAADIVMAKGAGRIFTGARTASKGRKAAAFLAERFIVDPLGEGAGEALAQLVADGELDGKETFAEILGSVGMNSAAGAVNVAQDARKNSNTKIANELTTIDGLNKELSGFLGSTPSRVSAWATNMEKLGQISSEQNQRIQLNLGLRKDAANILSATPGRTSKKVLERTMELMAAEERLTSTEKRKQVYSKKIKEINEELAELAETKTVRKKGEGENTQVDLTGLIGKRQTSKTDIRKSTKASYSIDGRTMGRKKFMDIINDMSPKELAKIKKYSVVNDLQSLKIAREKFGSPEIVTADTQVDTQVATDKDKIELKKRINIAINDFAAATDIEGKVVAVTRFLNNATTSKATVSQEDKAWYDNAKAELEAEGYVFDNEIGREITDNEIVDIKNKRKSDQVPKGVMIVAKVTKPRRLVDGKQTESATYDVIEGTGTTVEREALVAELEAAEDNMTPQNFKETRPRFDAATKALKEYDAANFTSPIQTDINIDTEVDTEATTAVDLEVIDLPEAVNKPNKNDKQSLENDSFEQTRLDGILLGISNKIEQGRKLTPFQENVKEKYSERLNEVTTSKNIEQEKADLEDTIKSQMKIRAQRKVETKETVLNAVEKTKKAIAKILPNVDVKVYENESDYLKVKDASKGDGGMYDGKTIHINLSNSNSSTVAHEGFHALLLNAVKNDEKLAKKISEDMVRVVQKKLPENNKLRIAIEKHAAKYEGKIQTEEQIAELIGLLSSEEFGYTKLESGVKATIKKYLVRLAKKLGMPLPKDWGSDQEVVDLINTISGKLKTGEEITQQDVKLLDSEEGGEFLENPAETLSRKQIGDFDVSFTEQDNINTYIKDGRVTEPDDLSFLKDLLTTITSPDDMLAGEIKYNGDVIFEGEGGVFFVTKFGDVWASGKVGTANGIATALNKQLKENNGRAFLTLTKGTDSKLVSSASGVNSTLAILNTMLDEELISTSTFRRAAVKSIKIEREKVIKKAKQKAKKKKKTYIPITDNNISLRRSAEDLKSDINKFFTDPTTSTFETRGNIVKDMLAEIAKNIDKDKQKDIVKFLGGDVNKKVGVGNTKLSQSFSNLVSNIASEKLTKGLSVGDVYAVIEINSEVEVKKDSHPSYPFHISLKDGSKPILHLPKNRESGSKILIQQSGKEYAVRNVSVVEGRYKNDTEIKPATRKQKGETKPAVRKQRTMQQVAREFNMSETGFFPKNVDSYFLKKAISKAQGDYGIKKARTGSFFLVDGRGRIVKDLFRRPQTRKQIIGENADLTYQQDYTLDIAKDIQIAKTITAEEIEKGGLENIPVQAMFFKNKTPQEIKYMTGWELGADNKWRYEVPDGVVLGEKIKKSGKYKLKDFYDAPDLYKAYPQLKNIPVELNLRDGGRDSAWYSPTENDIEINIKNENKYTIPSLLVHELQHAIQFIEFFGVGGNEKVAWQTYLENRTEADAKKEEALDKEIEELEKIRDISEGFELGEYDDFLDGLTFDEVFSLDFLKKSDFVNYQLGDEGIKDVIEYLNDNRKLRNEMQNQFNNDASFDFYEVDAWSMLLQKNKEKRSKLYSTYGLYQRLAGEVEARNAETRRLMSEKKRRSTTLEETEDTPREDQLNLSPEKFLEFTTRKQIIGENAELSTNVQNNLATAKIMESYASPNKIRLETGWERGGDKKWGYELPPGKFIKGISHKVMIENPNKTYKIKDIFDAPDLYKAYPNIKNTPISATTMPNPNSVASYSPNTNEILINTGKYFVLPEVIESAIIHELQHVIQHIEGFPRGGSVSPFKDKKRFVKWEKVYALNSFATNIAKMFPEKGWDITYDSDAVRQFEIVFKEKPNPNTIVLTSKLSEELGRGKNVLETDVYEILKNTDLSPEEQYKRIAGEVQARNVQKRKNFTEKQRRIITLKSTEDVARKDQTFFEAEQTPATPSNTITRKQKVDEQPKTLTNEESEGLLRDDESLTEIVRIGRDNNYSDLSIREVLKGRGFPVKNIDKAMEFNVEFFSRRSKNLPNEFKRIEGDRNTGVSGIERAAKLFNDINNKLLKFSTTQGPYRIGKKRIKTYSEIRQKAQQILKDHPIYKAQTEQVQMELIVGLDKSIGFSSNRSVTQEINIVKDQLAQRKTSKDNIQQSKLALKNYIRKFLPQSNTYTQAQINKLIQAVQNITKPEDYDAQLEKVVKIIEKQREKIKTDLIKQIYSIASKKQSSKSLGANAVIKFKKIAEVIRAAKIKDNDKRIQELGKIKALLEDTTVRKIKGEETSNKEIIKEAYNKVINNERLTNLERNLLELDIAYDNFSDIRGLSLEELQEKLKEVQQLNKDSIKEMKANKLVKAKHAQRVEQEANKQIQETNSYLFDEDGKPLNIDQLNAKKTSLRKDISATGIIKSVYEKLVKDIFGRTNQGALGLSGIKNFMTHLGTVTNYLDRKGKGLTLFTDRVYRALNRSDELMYQNERTNKIKLNELAIESGFDLGFKAVTKSLNKKFGFDLRGIMKLKEFTALNDKGKPYKIKLNANQLLRIYALSKNPTQKRLLENTGFDKKQIEIIKKELGPKLINFADSVINYLSTDYYDSVNAVYSVMNDTNLSYIENYFPTKTISNNVTVDMINNSSFGEIFDADTNSAFQERTNVGGLVNLQEGNFSDTLMNHFETMERYKAYAFTVKDISDLFEIKSVQTLLEATQLKNVTKTLLNVAINPKGYASAMGLDTERNFLSFAQRRMIDFTLGLKLIQIGKQATSFVNAFNQYSYLPEDSKVPRLIQLPVDILGFSFDLAASTFEMARGMFGDKGAIKKMREVSATFDKRIEKALEGEVHSLSSGDLTLQESGQPTSKLAKARRRWRQAKGAQTGIGDILGVMGYYVNYRRNIKNGMSEAAALEAFNDYNETQQSRRNTEKTLLQLSGNPFIRFFTSFSSTLFLQVNKTMQHSTNISRDVRNKKMPAKQDIRGLVINLSIANAFFTAMSNIMLLTSDDDDDRELAWKRIKQSMLGLNVVYAVPILGTSIQGLYEAFGDGNKPSPDYGVDPLQPMIRKYLKQYKKDPDDILNTYVKPMIEIAAGANSDPIVGTYNSTVNGLLQSNTSEEEFNKNLSDFFGITPSYQRGYGQTTSDKLEGVIPLGGITTKEQLKRYDPELYDELYGEVDEIKKEINEERKELYKDMGYIEIGGKLYPDED